MRRKISAAEKLKAVEDYLSNHIGMSKICFEFGVEVRSLRVWFRKYKLH
jgi:transposase-like protein